MSYNRNIVLHSVEEYGQFVADATLRGWVIADRSVEVCPDVDGVLYEVTEIHYEGPDGMYLGVLSHAKPVHITAPSEMEWNPFRVTLEGDDEWSYCDEDYYTL